MINLSSTIEHESDVLPGVKFLVRVANQYQRAKMEAEIMEQFLEMRELQRQIFTDFTEQEIQKRAADVLAELSPVMTNGHAELFEKTAALIAEYQGIKTETPEVRGASARAGLILEQHIKPATIKAGLVAIEGLSIDDHEITDAEDLINRGPSDLVTEVFTRCQEAATLTPDQEGNWRLPGGSARQTDGPTSDSTAGHVSSGDITKSETARSTSPPT